MHRCSSLAQVHLHRQGQPPQVVIPRRLRHCVALHASAQNQDSISTVTNLCPVLQDGCFYIPSMDEHSISSTCTQMEAHIPLQVFLLWPALQLPPTWLARDYHAARSAEVHVRWRFTFKQIVFLKVTDMSKAYEEQPMVVWQLRKHLQSGGQVQLPPAGPAAASYGALMAKPWFSYILCFKRLSGVEEPVDSSEGLVDNTLSPAAFSRPLGLHGSGNLAGCSLQEVYVGLEEGTFHPSMLDAVGADALLERVMLEGDDELLQMLMDEGLGDCCTVSSLQLLLQYACQEQLPQLARQALQREDVEVTQQVLQWLAHELLVSSTVFDLEHLLMDYCIRRRNPLSSIAAVEEALASIGESNTTHSQLAAQLSHKFKAAKHALLQQLLQQTSVQPLAEQDLSMQTSSSYSSMSGGSPSRHDKVLQDRLILCLAERGGKNIGRGALGSSLSIHDSSPYAAALRLRDAKFLSLPPIIKYTLRLWDGIEMETMLSELLSEISDGSVSFGGKMLSRKCFRKINMMHRNATKQYTPAATGQVSENAVVRLAANLSYQLTEGPTASGPGCQGLLQNGDGQSAGACAGPSPVAADTAGACAGASPVVADTAGACTGPSPVNADTADGLCHLNVTCTAASSTNILPTDLSESSPGSAAAVLPVHSVPSDLAQANRKPVKRHVRIPASHNLAGRGKERPLSTAGPIAEGVQESSLTLAASTPAAELHAIDSCRNDPTESSCSPQQHFTAVTTAIAAAHNLESAVNSSRWLNPLVFLELLQSLGLAGEGSQPLAWVGSQALHMAVVAPRALYCCPKGRWTVRCLFELVFLLEYQVTVTKSEHSASLMSLGIFPLLALGNLVDMGFQLHYKHKYRLQSYLSDNWTVLDAAVNLGQFAVIVWAFIRLLPGQQEDGRHDLAMHDEGVIIHLDSLWAVSSAFAVLIWARAMGLIIPLSAKLGAMLYTLRRATAEAIVMVPLFMVLMLGFGTTLTVCYQRLPHTEYGTLAGALRTLVGTTGGALDLLWFEDHAQQSPFLRIWGQAVLICYIIVVNILIMTLLIAVITYSYHPSQVKAETTVMHAESVHHYHWHRRYGITCSPGNILQLLLLWLPTGYRSRVSPSACLKYWIPPVDGFVPENMLSYPSFLLATGPAEVGYLLFLLTLYPLMAVVAIAAFVMHTPFGVVNFAVRGYKTWVDLGKLGKRVKGSGVASQFTSAATSLDGKPSMELANQWQHQEARTPQLQARVPHSHPSQQSLSSSDRPPATASEDDYLSVAAVAPSAAHRAKVEMARLKSLRVCNRQGSMLRDRGSMQATGRTASATGRAAASGAGWVPVHHPRLLAGLAHWDLVEAITAGVNNAFHVIWQLMTSTCISLAAAAVGALIETALLLLLTLTLIWAWLTRLVYSLYCILVPTAADAEHSLSVSRTADLWSREAVQDAFTAASKSPIRQSVANHTRQYSQE